MTQQPPQNLIGWLRMAEDAGLDFDGIEALFAASMRDFRDRRARPGTERGADLTGRAGTRTTGAA